MPCIFLHIWLCIFFITGICKCIQQCPTVSSVLATVNKVVHACHTDLNSLLSAQSTLRSLLKPCSVDMSDSLQLLQDVISALRGITEALAAIKTWLNTFSVQLDSMQHRLLAVDHRIQQMSQGPRTRQRSRSRSPRRFYCGACSASVEEVD